MKAFEYFEPASLSEAVSLLSTHGSEARVIAGGTDLLVQMKYRLRDPRYLVNIKSLPELEHLTAEADRVRIGALTRLADVERSPVIRERFPVLAEAVHTIGSRQVRNRGTIGGNVCHASPSADSAPALLALGASAVIQGPQGQRTLPLDQFFVGPGQTALAVGEILAEIVIPNQPSASGGSYHKLGIRKAMEIAIVGVAATVSLGAGKVCRDVKIALAAVAPTPLRARQAEEVLLGQVIDATLARQAGEVAGGQARPITDMRASAEYRRDMVQVLVRRAVLSAVDRATQD